MSNIRPWNRLAYRARPRLLVGALAAGALLLASVPAAYAGKFERRPVLIVHGFESAGSNFASQAMRFESNGYPHSWVEEIDYDSTAAVGNHEEVDKQIDEAIAALKQRTGKSQVDLIGHSEGTSVSYSYLTEGEKAAERKANVAAYVNMDGQQKNPGVRYEFALVKPRKTLHIYMEPFPRNDYVIRLLGSQPLENYTGKQPKSSGAVMIRYKEYWGNEPGQNDELLVNGLNICTPALCPVSKLVNAYFAFNWEGKEETTLNPDPVTSALPFIQGAQVYIPASSPPNAIVKYQLNSRGGGGLRTLNIPNWEGTTDQVTIYWNDFESLNF